MNLKKVNLNTNAIVNGALLYIILIFSLWSISILLQPYFGQFTILFFMFLPAIFSGLVTVRIAKIKNVSNGAIHGFLSTFILNVYLVIFTIIALTSSPKCIVSNCLQLLNVPLIILNVVFSTLSSTLSSAVYGYFAREKFISVEYYYSRNSTKSTSPSLSKSSPSTILA